LDDRYGPFCTGFDANSMSADRDRRGQTFARPRSAAYASETLASAVPKTQT
jgi:hypothetical protein